jgi:hypothetical protein
LVMQLIFDTFVTYLMTLFQLYIIFNMMKYEDMNIHFVQGRAWNNAYLMAHSSIYLKALGSSQKTPLSLR